MLCRKHRNLAFHIPVVIISGLDRTRHCNVVSVYLVGQQWKFVVAALSVGMSMLVHILTGH